MGDEKSWNIEPKNTKNIYLLIKKVLKHWTKWNKSQYLICFYLWCGTWKYLNSFCIKCATWQNLILFHSRSLLIYIYIYWCDLTVPQEQKWKCELRSLNIKSDISIYHFKAACKFSIVTWKEHNCLGTFDFTRWVFCLIIFFPINISLIVQKYKTKNIMNYQSGSKV